MTKRDGKKPRPRGSRPRPTVEMIADELLPKHFPTLKGRASLGAAYRLSRATTLEVLTGYRGDATDDGALDGAEKALKKAAIHLAQLSEHVHRELELGSQISRESGSGRLYDLGVSPKEMVSALLAGIASARRSTESGGRTRANMRAAGIVRQCELIWEEVTGEPAGAVDPRWRSHKAFHAFARDVLDAFGEDDEVPSAQGVWQKHVRSSGETGA